MAQGIYGLVIGGVCLVAVPFDLPLTAIALVPAILALGFGGMHVRDALRARQRELRGTDSLESPLR